MNKNQKHKNKTPKQEAIKLQNLFATGMLNDVEKYTAKK